MTTLFPAPVGITQRRSTPFSKAWTAYNWASAFVQIARVGFWKIQCKHLEVWEWWKRQCRFRENRLQQLLWVSTESFWMPQTEICQDQGGWIRINGFSKAVVVPVHGSIQWDHYSRLPDIQEQEQAITMLKHLSASSLERCKPLEATCSISSASLSVDSDEDSSVSSSQWSSMAQDFCKWQKNVNFNP